jgi:hypothetical protein
MSKWQNHFISSQQFPKRPSGNPRIGSFPLSMIISRLYVDSSPTWHLKKVITCVSHVDIFCWYCCVVDVGVLWLMLLLILMLLCCGLCCCSYWCCYVDVVAVAHVDILHWCCCVGVDVDVVVAAHVDIVTLLMLLLIMLLFLC